jgi:hypothetical protein
MGLFLDLRVGVRLRREGVSEEEVGRWCLELHGLEELVGLVSRLLVLGMMSPGAGYRGLASLRDFRVGEVLWMSSRMWDVNCCSMKPGGGVSGGSWFWMVWPL